MSQRTRTGRIRGTRRKERLSGGKKTVKTSSGRIKRRQFPVPPNPKGRRLVSTTQKELKAGPLIKLRGVSGREHRGKSFFCFLEIHGEAGKIRRKKRF